MQRAVNFEPALRDVQHQAMVAASAVVPWLAVPNASMYSDSDLAYSRARGSPAFHLTLGVQCQEYPAETCRRQSSSAAGGQVQSKKSLRSVLEWLTGFGSWPRCNRPACPHCSCGKATTHL